MKFDIFNFYNDYRIPHETEGHKHTQEGWVNIECPFCVGNPGLHLGYNIDGGFYHCWRCGGKSIISVIEKLLKVSKHEAYSIYNQYSKVSIQKPKVKISIRKKAFRLPSGLIEGLKQGRMYLEKRGFDPKEIEELWNIQYTSIVSGLDNIDFRFRIIIPIYWEGKICSFTSRDYYEKSSLKYISCPKDRELIYHKNILYGKQNEWKETGICVEGPTDVWRFGVNSFASFGIKFTRYQVRLIAKTFRSVPVVFDGNEKQARKQADKLIAELKFLGVDSFRVDIDGDPGGMKQEEANYIIKQLIH